MYLQLLHHHDSEAVPRSLLDSNNSNNTLEARATALSNAIADLGIGAFSVDIILKVIIIINLFYCLLILIAG